MAVARSPWPREEPELARGGEAAFTPELSIVVPVLNEEDSVEPLYRSLTAALSELARTYEIVVVDDGSTDSTYARFDALAAIDPSLKLVRLRRRYGQSAAMAAGFDAARGKVI